MTEDTSSTPAPDASTDTPTPPAATEISPDEFKALQAKYERAQKDLAKFRTRAEEVEAAQKTAEAERLKQAPLEERLKALEAEREELARRAVNAERLASITGKVADPKAALKLLDDAHLTEDGVNVDALLRDYPFLAPQPAGTSPTKGAGGGTPRGALTLEDFKGKSEAWRVANWDRYVKQSQQ
jgi:hypothetical protein